MEENEKQIKINVPAGYVIDEENSTFSCIKLKKKESRFGDYDGNYHITGYYIEESSDIEELVENKLNYSYQKNVFVSEAAAKSALAFAQITQIRKHGVARYGITPSLYNTGYFHIDYNSDHTITIGCWCSHIHSMLDAYLSFDTLEHAKLFLAENHMLIRDYYMMN